MKIKFNPDSKTRQDCLYPATKITGKENATQYLDDYAKYLCKKGFDEQEAKNIALNNIIFYASQCGSIIQSRVASVFLGELG